MGLVGNALPGPALKKLLAAAVRGLGISLCLHRVSARPRSSEWQKTLSIPAYELDELLELLLSAGPARLSVTFDDGYSDAAGYLRTRAARFPTVDFTFFICPEKAEVRAGFRWDLVEESLKRREPRETAMALLKAPADVTKENARPELRALTGSQDYALCTVEELKELTALPNVRLGNHTNLHLSSANAPDEVVRADFEHSTAAFTRLFGAPTQFAFPFGTPRFHFQQRHVDWLRALGDFPIWTTEARPYRLVEVKPQAVLPRFPVNGTKNASTVAGWIAARSFSFRARGTKHHFPAQ